MNVRQIIAAILVLSILGIGTAWAFDGHTVDVTDHSHALDRSDAAPPFDDHDCDHCCHSGAHLLGLGYASKCALSLRFVASKSAVPEVVFVTRATDPPLKPPQS